MRFEVTITQTETFRLYVYADDAARAQEEAEELFLDANQETLTGWYLSTDDRTFECQSAGE